MVRLSISMPDEFHSRVKKRLPEEGYNSLNDYLLDLLRHRIGAITHQSGANGEKMQNPVNNSHQSGATSGMKVKVNDKEVKVKKPNEKESGDMCEHGYLRKLCTHESCRKKG